MRDFGESSHCLVWLFPQTTVSRFHAYHAEQLHVTAEELNSLYVYCLEIVQRLGERFALRQRVISTAKVYFKRFYFRNCMNKEDPYLMIPTCLYLSSKAEESMVSPNHLLAGFYAMMDAGPWEVVQGEGIVQGIEHKDKEEEMSRGKRKRKDEKEEKKNTGMEKENSNPGTPGMYTVSDMLTAEYDLLEELDFYLVVHHPYRSFVRFCTDCEQNVTGVFSDFNELIQYGWKVVNDSYASDVCLIYAPHEIALGALYGAARGLGEKSLAAIKEWMLELNVDFARVYQVCVALVHMYVYIETYDQKMACELITRIRQEGVGVGAKS